MNVNRHSATADPIDDWIARTFGITDLRTIDEDYLPPAETRGLIANRTIVWVAREAQSCTLCVPKSGTLARWPEDAIATAVGTEIAPDVLKAVNPFNDEGLRNWIPSTMAAAHRLIALGTPGAAANAHTDAEAFAWMRGYWMGEEIQVWREQRSHTRHKDELKGLGARAEHALAQYRKHVES